jgi:hypothetical protein
VAARAAVSVRVNVLLIGDSIGRHRRPTAIAVREGVLAVRTGSWLGITDWQVRSRGKPAECFGDEKTPDNLNGPLFIGAPVVDAKDHVQDDARKRRQRTRSRKHERQDLEIPVLGTSFAQIVEIPRQAPPTRLNVHVVGIQGGVEEGLISP